MSASRGLGSRLQRWWNRSGRHRLLMRSTGHSRLVVILAGHHTHLWPATLERLHALGDDADVCLVCPGGNAPAAHQLAARCAWSVLTTRSKRPGLGLSLAVLAHPQAKIIHKLDEDIVLPAHYFRRLEAALERAEQGASDHPPGLIAPLLNVNPFCHVQLVRRLGLEGEWTSHFGPLRSGLLDSPAYHSAEAARFLWRACTPFAAVDARLRQGDPTPLAVPHRFCIGAIAIRREILEGLGLFRRPFIGPILGGDEDALCHGLATRGLSVLVDPTTLAGHLGFAPQRAGLAPHLSDLLATLTVPTAGDKL